MSPHPVALDNLWRLICPAILFIVNIVTHPYQTILRNSATVLVLLPSTIREYSVMAIHRKSVIIAVNHIATSHQK